jgi:hypothetical protein
VSARCAAVRATARSISSNAEADGATRRLEPVCMPVSPTARTARRSGFASVVLDQQAVGVGDQHLAAGVRDVALT